MSVPDMTYGYIRNSTEETLVENFIERKLKALTEPIMNDDLFDTRLTTDETLYYTPPKTSKLHHINSTLRLVSERTNNDDNDNEVYQIRDINVLKL